MEPISRIVAGDSNVSGIVGHETMACAVWKKAVGGRIAQRTRAIKLVRDTLVVEVEDELWRLNLWGLRGQILRNLDKALGPNIVLHLDLRIMSPRIGPQRATLTLVPAPGKLDEADEIQDPGLRRVYKAARRRDTA